MIKQTIKMALVSALFVGTLYADYGTVNGEAITDEEIEQTLGQPGLEFELLTPDMQERVLDMVVNRKLLIQFAAKQKVEDTAEYKAKLEMLKQELALGSWIEQENKKIEKSITDADVKAEYEKNQSKYSEPAQLKARHILVAKEDEAKAIIAELVKAKDVETAFIKLAETNSTGPSGPNGGDLGWFPLDRMVPEFSAAADKLKKGEFTKEPVKTQFGYHVIYLEDRKAESAKKFEEVQEEIKSNLIRDKFNKFMDEKIEGLKKDAKIDLKKGKEKK
ncbi:MAG: peptidyl-prolyl cis-trans isomerase [Campylobacterales bacterium]|nr:peptidyl-prolyl cis-trans isomerase [Campylobacterales bacterium]